MIARRQNTISKSVLWNLFFHVFPKTMGQPLVLITIIHGEDIMFPLSLFSKILCFYTWLNIFTYCILYSMIHTNDSKNILDFSCGNVSSMYFFTCISFRMYQFCIVLFWNCFRYIIGLKPKIVVCSKLVTILYHLNTKDYYHNNWTWSILLWL